MTEPPRDPDYVVLYEVSTGRSTRLPWVDETGRRWDGRPADGWKDSKPVFHDQCQSCGFKISAPCYGVGARCPHCGEIARS